MTMIAGCASEGPTGYQAAGDGRFGYTETRIEDGRFRITYRGSGGMSIERVEQLALRRAAELTQTEGLEWFRVVSQEVSGEDRGGVSVGGGVGTGSYGRRSGVGVGIGGDFGRVGSSRYFTARLEILMGSGPRPDDPAVYRAGSVLENAPVSID